MHLIKKTLQGASFGKSGSVSELLDFVWLYILPILFRSKKSHIPIIFDPVLECGVLEYCVFVYL